MRPIAHFPAPRCGAGPAPALAGLLAVLWLAPFPVAPDAQNAGQQTPAGKSAPQAASTTAKPAARRPAAPAVSAEDYQEAVAAAWKRITEATSEGTVKKRAGALLVLANAGDGPEVMAILEQAMKDAHPELRKAAASAFGQMHARKAIPQLQKALDDPAPTVRVAAARALWQMHDYAGSDLLVRLVTRRAPAEEARMRREWHAALGRVDEPSAVLLLALGQGLGFLPGPTALAIPLYRELSADKSSPARATAATLLGEHPSPEGIEALELALVDPEPVVRAAAAVALGKCGRAEEIIQLSPLLHDHAATVRLAGAVGIVRLGAPGSGGTK